MPLDLFEIGEHLRKSIENLGIYAEIEGKKNYVTASVGVLGFESERDARAREIIGEVDELMYKAKKSTKNATFVKNNII
jgi:diguanylate cyclase (GGDEF)-like protein